MMRYILDNGDWFLLGDGFRLACCSCSLVHDIEIRRGKNGTEMRIVRNERATVAKRHKMKRKVIIVGEDD